VVPAPFGALGVRVRGDALVEISFLAPGMATVPTRLALAREAVRQFDAYLHDPRIRFDLKLDAAGTEFQKRVWGAMTRIPVGETRTYGDLARELGSAPRAVGQACGANPLPVIVPCHRVVSGTGLGGFAHATDGFLLGVKRWLLAHEAQAAPDRGSLLAHASR
jgi:methylated-DNA-[protein]-cysteine S-methyltransferase